MNDTIPKEDFDQFLSFVALKGATVTRKEIEDDPYAMFINIELNRTRCMMLYDVYDIDVYGKDLIVLSNVNLTYADPRLGTEIIGDPSWDLIQRAFLNNALEVTYQ